MDDDGFTLHSRRRRGTAREPARDGGKEAFLREVPSYAGTSEEFEKAHARRYGKEEGLGPDGMHGHGQAHFPRGSDRLKLHTQYSASTNGRDSKRDAYDHGLRKAKKDFASMDDDEQKFYRTNSGGLTPLQHERLDPRAREYRDISLSNAQNRRVFLERHPHGYHSAQEQKKHHQWANDAYSEYEYAQGQQELHERHRSYSNVDPRRDPYGRPVSHR